MKLVAPGAQHAGQSGRCTAPAACPPACLLGRQRAQLTLVVLQGRRPCLQQWGQSVVGCLCHGWDASASLRPSLVRNHPENIAAQQKIVWALRALSIPRIARPQPNSSRPAQPPAHLAHQHSALPATRSEFGHPSRNGPPAAAAGPQPRRHWPRAVQGTAGRSQRGERGLVGRWASSRGRSRWLPGSRSVGDRVDRCRNRCVSLIPRRAPGDRRRVLEPFCHVLRLRLAARCTSGALLCLRGVDWPLAPSLCPTEPETLPTRQRAAPCAHGLTGARRGPHKLRERPSWIACSSDLESHQTSLPPTSLPPGRGLLLCLCPSGPPTLAAPLRRIPPADT